MILDSNILLGVLAVCVLAVVADIFHLRHKLKKILRTKNCNDIGEVLITASKDIKDLQKFKIDMESYLKNVEHRLRRSTQASETVRFNAFKDSAVGGNQSFATAFINENGDGAIISSLYSRDRVSVFAKSLTAFKSEYDLSEEEKKALSLAKAKLNAR